MTTQPTAAEFMAQTGDDEDEQDTPTQPAGDPLESIAQSLWLIAGAMTDRGDNTVDEILEETREERDDWEDKHRAAVDLLGEIRAIVKSSTSKVSLEVKAAIERWANPVVEAAVEPADPFVQPAHDADVEEWRQYARSLGYQGPDVDTANRSQIRTMLGIEQPAS